MKKLLCLMLFAFSFWIAKPVVAAGPMLKFVPSSGSYTNGNDFTITIGIDSGTEKVQAVDVWTTFDTAKLEVVSVIKAINPAFDFNMGAANIDEAGGKFDITFSPSAGGATFEAKAVSGDLAVVTFKAKATGTANVNFTCAAGSTIDSNIFNISTNDVIDCTSNLNGSYTITDGGTSNPDPTATPTTSSNTSNPTAVPTQASELPQTGRVETTVGLMIFGIVSVLSSLALKFL